MILTMVAHGATAATRSVAFPDAEERLETGAAAAAARAGARLRRVDRAWTGPERRARETAELMGLEASVEAALRDLDSGAWAGRRFEAVAQDDPDGVAAWLGDPDAAPHGGETVRALIGRVEAWLGAIEGGERLVAVSHAAVLRAAVVTALGAPAEAFWRIDVAPLGQVRLQGVPGRWTLAGLGR